MQVAKRCVTVLCRVTRALIHGLQSQLVTGSAHQSSAFFTSQSVTAVFIYCGLNNWSLQAVWDSIYNHSIKELPITYYTKFIRRWNETSETRVTRRKTTDVSESNVQYMVIIFLNLLLIIHQKYKVSLHQRTVWTESHKGTQNVYLS